MEAPMEEADPTAQLRSDSPRRPQRSDSSSSEAPQDGNPLPNKSMPAAELPNEEKPLQHPHYKSFKKKFLKLRSVFEIRSRINNQMFEAEDKLSRVSRRFKEQNDALREILLDINDSKCIPDYLRYDLRSPPPDIEAVPPLEPDFPLSRPRDAASRKSGPPVSIAQLNQLSQTTLEQVKVDATYREEIDDAVAPSYFSTAQEEEYLRNLDAKLGIGPAEATSLPQRPVDRDREHYKDVQLRNPVSVYNWLKRNKPEIFLQEDADAEEPPKKTAKSKSRGGGGAATGAGSGGTDAIHIATAKPSPKATAQPRSSKRARIETIKSEEVLDDDGNVIGGGFEEPAPRSKRKRDDEPYRPKGGSSKKKKRKTAGGSIQLSKELVEPDEDCIEHAIRSASPSFHASGLGV